MMLPSAAERVGMRVRGFFVRVCRNACCRIHHRDPVDGTTRVHRIAVALLLALIFGQAHASIEPRWTYVWEASYNNVYNKSSPEEVCAALWVASPEVTPTYESLGVDSGRCWGGVAGNPHRFGPWGVARRSKALCPAYSEFRADVAVPDCVCSSGFVEDPTHKFCTPAVPGLGSSLASSNRCQAPVDGVSVGHPIVPATGEKYRIELDWNESGTAPLSFARTYRSTWGIDPSVAPSALGHGWNHNHAWRLVASPASAPSTVVVTSPDGYLRSFSLASGASAWTPVNSADTLAQTTGGAWTYRRSEDDVVLNFDAAGRLQTKAGRSGWVESYAYNSVGLLIRHQHLWPKSAVGL